MKISKWIMAVLIATTTFVSCSKDNGDDNNTNIEGDWVGTYSDASTNATFDYRLRIKPNGEVQELNSAGTVIGTGGWELDNTNNVFMAEYEWTNGQDFSIIADFLKQDGKLIGSWGYDNSNSDGGTFELQKQ